MALVVVTLARANSTAPADGTFAFDDGTRGIVDAAGVGWADVAAGDYLLTTKAGGVVSTLPVYLPTLEGPYDVSSLLTKRPGKAMTVYGPAGFWGGLDGISVTSSEQTIETNALTSLGFLPGKTMGWCAFAAGKLFICGQDQDLNALKPTSFTFPLSVFDPGSGSLQNLLATTTRNETTITTNGTTGGAYGADVQAVPVGSETFLVQLTSNPTNGGADAFPLLATARLRGGSWVLDPTYSYTCDELHASGALGADAFPNVTDSTGTYAQALLCSEIDVTPASHVILTIQYGSNPNYPANKGGSVVAIDPATGNVLARYIIPFTVALGAGTADQIAPRSLMVDPTGTIGSEAFAFVYDTFLSSADAGFNVMQMYVYDSTGPSITPISNWVKTTLDSADHWTNGGFDANGWLYWGRRTGLTVKPVAVFPKVDGSWKLAQYPFAWSTTFGQICDPDFTVPIDSSQSAYWNTRCRDDAATSTILNLSTNFRLLGIKHEGDAHSPRLTLLPIVATDTNTYLSTGLPSTETLQPMDGDIDPVGRAFYVGVGDIYKAASPWPVAPVTKPGWLFAVDIDRCFATPSFRRSGQGDQLTKTTVTPALPTNWAPGDLVVYVFANTLVTDPASAPITVSGGWTKAPGSEVRNGTAGLRYMTVYRYMQTGDVAPTFSWTGNANLVWGVLAIVGADSTTPIDAFAIATGPPAGGTNTLTAPSVTPSLAGCRIIHAYISQGSASLSASIGETTPGEVKRIDRAGTTLSCCVTEEEQLATTNPTKVRYSTYPANGLNAALTIAIRPAAAAANPPAVSTVACVPNPVAHGNTTVVTVTLASPATRDTIATVTASNAKATVPYTCFIASGASSGTVTANAITAGTVTISAKTVGAAANAVLTIT